MKRLTVDEIRAIAEKYMDDYEVIAIRTQNVPFELGEMTHESKVWDDGDETEESLNGICATNIKNSAVDMHSSDHTTYRGYYDGEYQAIIAGNYYSYGEDNGEIIISDPIVVEIIA